MAARVESTLRTLAQFALREAPLWRGKHRLVHLAAPLLGELPEPAYAKLAGGARMLMTPTERRDFWYLGNIEPQVTPVFLEQLGQISRDSVFVDVGANRGYYTLIAAQTHKVFAFEPNEEPLSELERSLQFNGFDNVTAINAAVSECSGREKLYLHESVSELSSLRVVHDDLEHSIEVESVSLDDYFGERPEVEIGLIKLDIQGGELLALRGAQKILEEFHPILILEEWPFGAAGFGYEIPDLKRFLAGHGYRFFTIEKGRLRWSLVRPADPIAADVGMGRELDTNLLCLPSDRI